MKCPHCSEELSDVVPRERLNTKTQAIKELQKQLSEAQEAASSAEGLQAAADALRTELEAERTSFQAYKLESETSAELLRAGITDPEDMDLARWRYSKIDEPPPFSEWLSSAAREDRHLARLFETPSAEPVAAPEQAEPAPPASAPPANAGARQAAVSPPPRYSLGEISTMPLEQLREAIAAGAFK